MLGKLQLDSQKKNKKENVPKESQMLGSIRKLIFVFLTCDRLLELKVFLFCLFCFLNPTLLWFLKTVF